MKRFDLKMRDVLPRAEGERFCSLFTKFPIVEYEVKEYNKRFVEAHPLTEGQRVTIVTEEDITTVVAKARTGKT